ncbi:hypothetical protein OKW30_003701 [Paraburkholderia sp. Clong3]|uniref:HAD domain-containing protein n=1 Tax=Paraburkholderia sp. Clong3 TaxID=2991061 RepID=UPI003D20EF51
MTIVAPRRRLTLFTNIDGVLQYPAAILDYRRLEVQMDAPGHQLFEWSEPLIAVCADFDVEIVLRSRWTARLPLNRVLPLLPAELAACVVGATWPTVERRLDQRHVVSRYRTTREHVEWNGLVYWIAIDDNDDGWSSDARQHLVLCDPDFGLSLQRTELELREKRLFLSNATRA